MASTEVATTPRTPARQSRPTYNTYNTRTVNPPRTEYVYVQNKGIGGSSGGGRFNYSNSRLANTLRTQPAQVPVPEHLPRFLGNASIVGYAWVGAMLTIGFDEWHNNDILPRPARLWYTSLVYGLLALTTIIPALIPLANALAIGYTIMLLWQYFNKQGQFG